MRIALVEDHEVLAKSIEDVLAREGYAVTRFADGTAASLHLIETPETYDLVILDVLLPGVDGLHIARAMRAAGVRTPILMLTARGASGDIVSGLDAGADDYLTKPFIFDELLARARSLLRRMPDMLAARIVLNPDVTVDMAARTVYRKGVPVHLTAKEFAILTYFLHNPGVLLTQQQIYDHVFDFADAQLSNTIEVHIKNIRKKLRTERHELPVVTVRSAGYRYEQTN